MDVASFNTHIAMMIPDTENSALVFGTQNTNPDNKIIAAMRLMLSQIFLLMGASA